MSPELIFLAVVLYLGILLAIAFLIEKDTPAARKIAASPAIYSLSLAVYCTSWTYYGSVGRAANAGLSYLGVYLGPTIMICIWWTVLYKMVRIKDRYHITSIADFISARYDKSQAVAAVVTLITLIGNMPYIALQLKAIRSSFLLTTISSSATGQFIANNFGLFIVVTMVLFTILFGARKLDPTERHRGMVAVVAMESVIKLVAFLACGIYVTFFLADGFSDIFSPRFLADPRTEVVLSLGQGGDALITWGTMILLGMSAILFLPRQFHVAVVENSNPRNILPAMWQFPLYMMLISFFVVPIALYGINAGIPLSRADTYVLAIPIKQENILMALLVFIGGFSSATGMIMIAAMAMATMTVNHLLLPLFNYLPESRFLHRHLLRWRWVAIAGIIATGHWFEVALGDTYALVNMGLISFAAVCQFAPAGLGGLFWSKGNKAGVLTGLCLGFALWFYTLLLPAFIKSGWLSASLLQQGPWGLTWLRPEQFLGVETLPALAHGVFWSLLANVGAYLLVSCLVRQSEEERQIALDFCAATPNTSLVTRRTGGGDIIDMRLKCPAILAVLNLYYPPQKSAEILDQALARFALKGLTAISIIDFAECHRYLESIMAGSIGSAMAHRALNREAVFPRAEKELLAKAYADILASLNVSPQELSEKIDFYKEREELLLAHSRELEKRISEKEKEIDARIQAEQQLQKAEQQYRSIFNNALEGIFQTDGQGHLITVNPAMAAILGYSSPVAVIKQLADIRGSLGIDPGRRDTLFRRLIAGRQVKNFEIQIRHASGKILWLNMNARPILDENRALVRIEGIVEDITLRKEAEEKLARYHEELEEKVRLRTAEVRENQVFLQEVLEGIMAAVIVVDQESKKVLDCNSISEQVLGFAKSALLDPQGPLSKSEVAIFKDLGSKSLNRELLIERQNGEKIPVLRNVLPVVYRGVLAYAIIIFDISERKALEQQVGLAHKLQAIGQLAAGIAHEINTPIQYIGNNIGFLSESFDQLLDLHRAINDLMELAKQGHDVSDSLDELAKRMDEFDLEFLIEEIPHAVKESLEGVHHVANIVKAMKNFAHPEQESLVRIDINQALEQTAVISKNEWKYVADVIFDFDPNNPCIYGYPSPLNQVFLNIIVNAAQAIAEGYKQNEIRGTITIRTRGSENDVTIQIADTGIGIPTANLPRIFDPFFTTKVVGAGTGQGLSISYNTITKKHGGTIEVASNPGHGTEFTIRLPIGDGTKR